MYIHFTFGHLGKSGKLDEQFSEFTKKILTTKHLKVSVCQEFIPIPNESSKNAINFDIIRGSLEQNAFSLSSKHLTSPSLVSYLPVDVPMICFIKCPLKKLKNHPHQNEYGKLGIVFTKKFYKKNNLKPVIYYSEENIKNDPLIKKYIQNGLDEQERQKLSKEITTYRKPKVLNENFPKSAVARITMTENGNSLSIYTYDRYPVGYDFTTETEHRIAFDPGTEFLPFNENDVFMIIVPNTEIEKELNDFFKKNWSLIPCIEVYPA